MARCRSGGVTGDVDSGLRDHNPDEETCYGLRLQLHYVDTADYRDMRSGVIWRRLCDPGRNCSEMIRLYGRNIRKDTESAEASP
jgi:hypothetical protein